MAKLCARCSRPFKVIKATMVCRDSTLTCIHLAILSARHVCAQHVVVWSALVRPRPHYYLWYACVLFGLYVLCCHGVLYCMHSVVTYVHK
jgi:hypothetical protein